MNTRIAANWLICLAFGLGMTTQAIAKVTADPNKVWAQTYSDVKPDPAVTFGQLPNGLRYAILRNQTPKNQASIRLRFASGSLQETDSQQGLAHFLEHMAFKGSNHVPEGDMVKVLERHGLAFGPDTNAFTSFDQTVYQLDLPLTEADTFGTGLMLMREVASELTLSAKAFEPERGVVQSEERLRGTPGFRAQGVEMFKFLFEGQPLADRMPIGKVSVLQNAPVTLLRQYYETYYRPDRASLIVVGDINPVEVEAAIKARFGDWKSPKTTVAPDRFGTPKPRGLEARVYAEPGVTAVLSLAWVRPFDSSPDSLANRRRDIIRKLALDTLNRRFEKLNNGANAPFLSAQADDAGYFRSAEVTDIGIVPKAGDWKAALTAVETVRREIITFGITPAELDREIVETRTDLSTAVAGATTRRTPGLADALTQAAAENEVYTPPTEDLAEFEAAVKGLTVDQVSEALRGLFTGSGPLVYFASPEPLAGGDAALLAAYKAVSAAPLTRPVADAVKVWPYSDFGPAGQVADRREITEFGTSFVRFANGVRLTIKPTKFSADSVNVLVSVGGGLREIPKDQPNMAWATSALVGGGLTALTFDELQTILAGKSVQIGSNMAEDSFNLTSQAKSGDLPTALQVISAYLTAPGFRPEAFERVRNSLTAVRAQIEATPLTAWQVDLPQALRNGDPRWSQFPDDAQIKAARPEDLKALLGPVLDKGAIDILIVGDVTVDEAVAQVAKTLGALPARPAGFVAPPGSLEVHFPAPTSTPLVKLHKGKTNQAVASIAWPAPDALKNRQEARIMSLATKILESRLLDQIRVTEGATYSPITDYQGSRVFPGYGYVLAAVETPPDRVASFYANIARITSDMATKGVTQDELDRARKPQIEGINRARQSNGYWIGTLSGAQTDPSRLEAIRESIPGREKVTPEDIQRLVKTYLKADSAWSLEYLPGPEAKPVASPAKL